MNSTPGVSLEETALTPSLFHNTFYLAFSVMVDAFAKALSGSAQTTAMLKEVNKKSFFQKFNINDLQRLFQNKSGHCFSLLDT